MPWAKIVQPFCQRGLRIKDKAQLAGGHFFRLNNLKQLQIHLAKCILVHANRVVEESQNVFLLTHNV